VSHKLSHQSLAVRFDHLLGVISSQRFLEMKGLNNDLPFYICEFKAAETFDIQRLQRQLVNKLSSLSVPCLEGRGIRVLEINLYDLTIALLQARPGSEEGCSLWMKFWQLSRLWIKTPCKRFCRMCWISRST